MPTAHSPENRHHLRLMRPGKERYPAARGSRINPLWLWFGVLGAPVAFGVARLVGIALTSGHCVRPAAASVLFGLTPAEQLMAAVTIAAALVAGAAGIASWHVWRRTRWATEEESGESLRSAPFWALGGLFLSGVFFMLILLTGGLAVGLGTTCAL